MRNGYTMVHDAMVPAMPPVWTLLSHVQMKLMEVTITSARTATLTK